MRSFESAGPDVKIRGTPSHIAEKYVTLARDALSSGDPVLAENYLQHAEHYNRIILTYREQMAQQGGMDPMGNGAARTHSLAGPEGSDGDEFDEDGDEFGNQQQPGQPGDASQPPQQQNFNPPQQQRNFDHQNRNDHRQQRHDNNRYNNNRHDRNDHRYDRNDRQDRQDFRGDRNDRNDRYDRNGSGGEHRYRDDRRPYNNGGDGQNDGGYRRRDRFQPQNGQPSYGAERDAGNGAPVPSPVQSEAQPVSPAPERVSPPPAAPTPPPQASQPAAEQQEQPAFLRRPVRRPRREEASEEQAKPAAAPSEDSK